MQKIMIPYFAFSGLLNFVVSLFLGILVYLKGKRIFTNRIFAYDALSVAFWSFGFFFWQISADKNSALFWSRFLMAGAIFIPVFYFHFIVAFLNLLKKYKRVLFCGYILALAFLLLDFTPYFVKNVEPELFFPFWPKPGIFYHPFLLMFFSFVVYGWYLLLKALQQTEEKIRKQQIKYFLLGTGIGFICGSTNYFLWYEIPIPPYLNIFVSLYVILTTFAILKYHLFEIRVILTEILVGVMGIILLVLPFLMPTLNLRILTFLTFLLFCVFARYLVKAVYEEQRRREEAERLAVRERALRKRTERFNVISIKLKEKLSQVLELETILKNIKEVLSDAFQTKKFSFALKQLTTEFYEIREIDGFHEGGPSLIIRDTPLCLYLERYKRILTQEILSLLIKESKDESEKEELKSIQQRLKDFEIELIFPLFQKNAIVGIFFLGSKLSSHPYTQEDIELLEGLSYQMSISIQNSLLYEEIKKDKEILEKFYKITELKMAELKNKIKELEEKLKEKGKKGVFCK